MARNKLVSDEDLIKKVNDAMAQNPELTRSGLVKKIWSSHHRIDDLEKRGLINIPKALSARAAATVARRRLDREKLARHATR